MGPRLLFHSFLVERISAEPLSLIPWPEESRQYTFTAANTVKEKLGFAAAGPGHQRIATLRRREEERLVLA